MTDKTPRTTASRELVVSAALARQMGPGPRAGQASCLAVEPDNRELSAARRALLLTAFRALDVNDQANLLELAESIAFNHGEARLERDDLRDYFRALFRLAGWDQPEPDPVADAYARTGEMPVTLPAHENDDDTFPWRVAWHGGDSWRAWKDRERAAGDYADMAETVGPSALGGIAVYQLMHDGAWHRTDLYREG
jgi:hypothetical protein